MSLFYANIPHTVINVVNQQCFFPVCLGIQWRKEPTDAQYLSGPLDGHICDVQFPGSEETRLYSLPHTLEHRKNSFTSYSCSFRAGTEFGWRVAGSEYLTLLDHWFLNLECTNDWAELAEQTNWGKCVPCIFRGRHRWQGLTWQPHHSDSRCWACDSASSVNWIYNSNSKHELSENIAI